MVHKFRSRIHYLDEAQTTFRVWPNDLDINMHMNNAVYLSVMDFGRFDLTYRSGFSNTVAQNNCYAVVGSQMIRYRRSLQPFQKFTVHTKLVGWDERFAYVQQKFIFKNQIIIMAVVKIWFLSKVDNKGVNPIQIFNHHESNGASPELPSWIVDWAKAEDQGWKQVLES